MLLLSEDPNTCFEKGKVPDSLNDDNEAPIWIFNGGSPGGGAAMAAELYAYLEAGEPLPKMIVGSSIGSIMAIYLQYRVSGIESLRENTSESEKRKYDWILRKELMSALKELFVKDFEALGLVKEVRDSILDIVGNEEKTQEKTKYKSSASQVFTFPVFGAAGDIFEPGNRSNRHFDIGVSVSYDIDRSNGAGYDIKNIPIIVYNEAIMGDIIDASTAHLGTSGKIICGTNYSDGDYGPYLKNLAEQIKGENQPNVCFFTSYFKENDRPYDFTPLEDKSKTVRVLGRDYLEPIVDKHGRGDLRMTEDIFTEALIEAKERYVEKRREYMINRFM